MVAHAARVPTPSTGAGGTTADLRRQNLGRALRAVHLSGPISRAALTQELGLNRGTVGIVIDTLAEGGLFSERDPETTGRGRPSPIIDVVSRAAIALTIELAVDSVRLSVVGLGGRLISSKMWSRSGADTDAEITQILAEVSNATERSRRTGARYVALSVAVWGIVRAPDGFITIAPSLGWRDVPLGDRLHDGLTSGAVKARSAVQHVTVTNDADLGALAEYRRGAGFGSRRMLYLHSDIGVGGGILRDGVLLSDAGGYCGEVGHMTMDPRGHRCDCGSTGCWQTQIDQRALLRAAGRDDVNDAHVGEEARRVLREAREGEPRAWAAVHEVSAALGAGLANLVQILGPDRIVLSPYLAELFGTAPHPARRILRERGFSDEARNVEIVPAALGTTASVIGAAELAFEPLLADPAEFLPR